MHCFVLNIFDNWTFLKLLHPTEGDPYFDVVVGLEWSNDPENDAGSSDATRMASRARQVKGDDPD